MGHKNKREDREARRAADLPPHVYDIAKQDTTYIHQTRLPNIQKDCERAVEAKDTDWLNKVGISSPSVACPPFTLDSQSAPPHETLISSAIWYLSS